MSIRKSMQEEMVVSGTRDDWMSKCSNALEAGGFTKVAKNTTLFQVTADYKKFMTWGSISVTLTPAGSDTKITVVSTANVDNIYALFKSPNKAILSAFKDCLK